MIWTVSLTFSVEVTKNCAACKLRDKLPIRDIFGSINMHFYNENCQVFPKKILLLKVLKLKSKIKAGPGDNFDTFRHQNSPLLASKTLLKRIEVTDYGLDFLKILLNRVWKLI